MDVAFVTSRAPYVLDGDVDRPLHEAAFAAAGIGLHHLPWDQPADWASFDLVVVRSPWDYPERLREFLPWLDNLIGLPNVQNPAALIRWNLDKHYLLELEAAGVPTVPTRIARTADGFRDALDELHAQSREVVVKPTISAGSRNTGRFELADPAAAQLADLIFADGGIAMVQPCIASVADEGEVALVSFNGELSHAFRKGPILEAGGGLIGGTYRDVVEAISPSPEQIAVANRAAAAVQAIGQERGWLPPGAPPLYARWDLVRLDDGSHALLEAELFEPSFYLPTSPGSETRFAEAVAARLHQA